MLDFLLPWQFDPFAAVGLALGGGLYAAGMVRGARPSPWAVLAYSLGLGAMYAVMHTRLDYYAQYLFSAHRAQHLVLHHLGPFLIALSNPLPVWRRALGGRVAMPGWLKGIYRVVQHPVVAPVLFVGLVYLWLTPDIHFDAMLSHRLYLLMNWSMAIDGLLFWWLMLVPRGPGHIVDLGYGTRVFILILVMFPQIVLGIYIALGPGDLYDVYAVCGRAFPISPEKDQLYGGIITWIPAAMMSVLGALIVLGRWMRSDAERAPADAGQTRQEE
ncbi:MAG: cytochrome c oxidase assembly protein [Chromatiales bacterium]|jgi:putative membrane protein